MINSRTIGDLHPVLQRGAKEFIKRVTAIGYPVLITQTYRDFEYQDSLYAQGRTKPGSIVTQAKGGQSAHNYKLAFDICKNVKGQEYSDVSFFQKSGEIGMKMGFEWGGSWKGFVDKPHFEFTNGLTLTQLKNGKTIGDNVKMKWEMEIVENEALYDKKVIEAIETLAKNGVISSPDYWLKHYKDIAYLDMLLVNMALKLHD